MQILHTVASLDSATGGPAYSVPGLVKALANIGAEVLLWSPDAPANWEEKNQYKLQRGSLDNVFSGHPTIRLVHDHGLWLPVNHKIAQATRQRSLKRIVSPRGMLEPWAVAHKKWKKKLAWHLYQRRDLARAHALHATASAEARQFKNLGLTNPSFVVPNGIDLSHTLDRKYHAAPIKTALFLSRIHPKKGLPLLVEAWSKIRPPGWQMKVAGPDEGHHLLEVKEQVEKAALSKEWHFYGPVAGEEKRAFLNEADLVILPTYSENFGMVIAEALANGIPVITTTGTPWEGLQSHYCGWWVDPNVSGLASALREATSMDDLSRQQMGEKGAAWMQKDFTWKSIATQMLNAYEEVLRVS